MKTCLVSFAAVSLCFELFGTPFENLDFDAANTNNVSAVPPGLFYGPTSELLPGWQLSSGPLLGYNTLLTGDGTVTIVDMNDIYNFPLVGLYTLYLSGTKFPGAAYTPVSLTQTGDIPSGTMSIRFMSFGAPYNLTVNGVPIGLTYDYLPGNYPPTTRPANVMGDISAFSGQTVQLDFTTVYLGLGSISGLDEISFSTIPVPEPSTIALLALGGLGFCRLWQRRSRRSWAGHFR